MQKLAEKLGNIFKHLIISISTMATSIENQIATEYNSLKKISPDHQLLDLARVFGKTLLTLDKSFHNHYGGAGGGENLQARYESYLGDLQAAIKEAQSQTPPGKRGSPGYLDSAS